MRDRARPATQRFIEEHLDTQLSFTFETTLRDVTFEQTRRAAASGFLVQMLFIAAGDVHEHIARVSNRAEKGGHSASPDSIAEIYARAMRHLVDAFDANRAGDIHLLHVFHNPRIAGVPGRPERIAGLRNGRPRDLAAQAPAWFHAAVQGTPYELERLRQLQANAEHECAAPLVIATAPLGAATRPPLTVTVIQGSTCQPEYRFDQDCINIGRGREVLSKSHGVLRVNDIVFGDDEKTVGREHASLRLYARSGRYGLYDDRSGDCGTRLFRDGVSILVTRAGNDVRSGDEIHLGVARLKIGIGDCQVG